MHLLLFLPWPKQAAHTTHILQPLNTSLAAASFECWGLDCHFSWQRHPSSHLCYHLAPANSPGPLCVTRTATADQTDWLQGLEKAKPYCWSTQEEGNLSGRSSSGRAELLLLPLPCLRLKQFSWEFYYNFITTSCPSHTTQPKKSGTGIRNLWEQSVLISKFRDSFQFFSSSSVKKFP